MKIKILVLFSMVSTIWHCSPSQKGYNIPPDLSREDKKELAGKGDLGRKLYKIHCSKCHGKSYKSMDQGPEFTEEQLKTYEVFMKIRNQTHEFTQKMNSEDIDNIIIYLKYRKIN